MVIRGVTVSREGEITWPAPPIQVFASRRLHKKRHLQRKTERKMCLLTVAQNALMAL
ncbi:hypothetical protein ACNKHN_09290 [Shigella flexneri]